MTFRAYWKRYWHTLWNTIRHPTQDHRGVTVVVRDVPHSDEPEPAFVGCACGWYSYKNQRLLESIDHGQEEASGGRDPGRGAHDPA